MWRAVLILALSASAFAQGQFDIKIPDPNPGAGPCGPRPFNPAWQSAAGEWRYQVLYSPALMGGRPCRITDLSVAPCGGGSFAAGRLEVRLSHTRATSLTTSFATNLNNPKTVLGASGGHAFVLTQDRWSPLHIQCPFEYDGQRGLVVEIRYTSGTVRGGDGNVRTAGIAPVLFAVGPGAFSAATGQPALGGLKVRFTCAQIWYGTPPSNPVPGGFMVPIYDDSAGGNNRYVGAASLSGGPVRVGCWPLDLGLDALFFLTVVNALPNIFVASHGTLSMGAAKTRVDIPSDPRLVGVTIYQAFATLDARGRLQTVARGNSFTIRQR